MSEEVIELLDQAGYAPKDLRRNFTRCCASHDSSRDHGFDTHPNSDVSKRLLVEISSPFVSNIGTIGSLSDSMR